MPIPTRRHSLTAAPSAGHPSPSPSKHAHRSHTRLPSLPASAAFFPPPGLALHPDDEQSKVFLAMGRALAAAGNCAMTVKDLAESALRHGLVCTGSAPMNAASQQITSFIRGHQRRCEETSTPPLIKCFALSGTSDDDKYTHALYSRAGGTAPRNGGAISTAFRKGTQVWYLAPESGFPDPFERAGIRIPGSKKRRRLIRKESSGDSEEERRPKIKLKIKLPLMSKFNSTCSRALQHSSKQTSLSDSSLSSPASSTVSLSLPPYPIASQCSFLRNIPNSPFDLPEYASPPPDSVLDEAEYNNRLFTSDFSDDDEFAMKMESDDEDSVRRSRSTSAATGTDPRTPRDIDQPLDMHSVKVEGPDMDVKHVLERLDSPSPFIVPPTLALPMKQEMDHVWHEPWMSDEHLLHRLDSPLFSDIPEPSTLFTRTSKVGRSYSTPPATRPSDFKISTPFTSSSLPISYEPDDVEIFEPDKVTPDEFEDDPTATQGLVAPPSPSANELKRTWASVSSSSSTNTSSAESLTDLSLLPAASVLNSSEQPPYSSVSPAVPLIRSPSARGSARPDHSRSSTRRDIREPLASPIWQRDGFTDWNVPDVHEPPKQMHMKASVPTFAISPLAKSAESPLSPAEEEMFRSLIAIEDPKVLTPIPEREPLEPLTPLTSSTPEPTTPESQPELERSTHEDAALDADDEDTDDKPRVRRSKRVPKPKPSRVPVEAARRSTRNRK